MAAYHCLSFQPLRPALLRIGRSSYSKGNRAIPTSWSGPHHDPFCLLALAADAYRFASDKPLALLNGANLLHMLEKHGYQAKIDIAGARAARTSL